MCLKIRKIIRTFGHSAKTKPAAMKRFPTILLSFLLTLSVRVTAAGGPVQYTLDPATGAISSLRISSDPYGMDWTVAPDGSQYEWIGPEWGWGLGRLKADGGELRWEQASAVQQKGERSISEYALSGALTLRVVRRPRGRFLEEEYVWTNRGKAPLQLSQVEIYAPFNDNYPDAQTCLTGRCHAHIWAGGRDAWVCALRMGTEAPHLGLALRKGSVSRYGIRERGRDKGSSNTRGIICLMPDDATLAPGAKLRIRWRLFAHDGWDDFFRTLRRQGLAVASADRSVAEVGDTVSVRFWRKRIRQIIDAPGEIIVRHRGSRVELLGVSRVDSLVARRARFILDRQQYHAPGDSRDGAFLPYDNSTDQLYLDWEAETPRNDTNEGRERLGMGVFLSQYGRIYGDSTVIEPLRKYARFVREQLQDPDYKTWGECRRDGWHRIYNYPWVTRFYLELYKLTGDRQYLQDACGTQMAAYRYGGYGFYSIDAPVRESISMLREAGMDPEADRLLGEYRKAAQVYMENGLLFPKFEVNYEQSIVAPSTLFLCEMFLVTGEQPYLEAARAMMPVLEAFGGRQPSSHLHDIAIRHWDGYWFGRDQVWGDTFPHYWSCITADCFDAWAECTGDESYRQRARQICLQNLSLLTEDGRGGCAYLYPDFIEGKPGRFLDPMANDQDWALVYWLRLKDGYLIRN